MKKKNVFALLLLLCFAAASCLLGGFIGGFMACGFLCLIIFIVVGFVLEHRVKMKQAIVAKLREDILNADEQTTI